MKFGSWTFFISKQNENPVPIATSIVSKAENPTKDNYKGSKRDFTELQPSF